MLKSVGIGSLLLLPLTPLAAQEILRVRWQGVAVQAFAAPNAYCIHGFGVSGPDASGYVTLTAQASDGSSGAVLRARWQGVSVQPFSGGGCLVGFTVSGPDPQGYVTLTAHAADGSSGDILMIRWNGVALQDYTAPGGTVIQALFTGGPDAQGYVILSADTVDAGTEVEEGRGDEETVMFGFRNLHRVIQPGRVITFGMPRAGDVRLEVFDFAGRRVRTLVSATVPEGYHRVRLPVDLRPGAYVLRLATADRVLARKVVVVRP